MAEKSAKELDPEVVATYEQLKVKHGAARNAQKRVCLLAGIPVKKQSYQLYSDQRYTMLELEMFTQGEQQIKDLEMNNKRSQLMLVQLSQLEPDTVTYKNVGKAYVMAPKSEIISSYEKSYAEGLATLKKRKADKEAVDKSVDSCLSELKEHLDANISLARAIMESQSA